MHLQIQQTLPYLLQQSEQVLSIEGSLLPLRYASKELRKIGRAITVYRSFFAYRIPHLPDQLNSPHLVSSSEQERLAEVLDHNVRLITNLGKRKDLAFALRFQTDSHAGEIKIALLVRAVSSERLATPIYQHFAVDTATVFQSAGYSVEPVLTESDLNRLLSPISNPMILEIRQHEELAAMTHGDAYVVYPFRPRLATWLAVCQTMLQQVAPCILNIYLELEFRVATRRVKACA